MHWSDDLRLSAEASTPERKPSEGVQRSFIEAPKDGMRELRNGRGRLRRRHRPTRP